MTAPLLGRCSRCPAIVTLLARIGNDALCGACWNKAGRPFPDSFDRREREKR